MCFIEPQPLLSRRKDSVGCTDLHYWSVCPHDQGMAHMKMVSFPSVWWWWWWFLTVPLWREDHDKNIRKIFTHRKWADVFPNNNSKNLSLSWYTPSIVLSTSQELVDVILTTTLWGKDCYIPILFMRKLRHTVYKWWSQDRYPGSLFSRVYALKFKKSEHWLTHWFQYTCEKRKIYFRNYTF